MQHVVVRACPICPVRRALAAHVATEFRWYPDVHVETAGGGIGELSVTDLSERVGCQVPNMSQHLAVLRNAGLVTSRREGNTILYRLADPRVLEAYRLIQDIAR